MRKKPVKIKKGPLTHKKWLYDMSANYRKLAETRGEIYPESRPFFLQKADEFHRLAFRAKN
jgi:hypothetical protein